MTLENLVQIKQLKQEAANKQEFDSLLSAAVDRLKDAKTIRCHTQADSTWHIVLRTVWHWLHYVHRDIDLINALESFSAWSTPLVWIKLSFASLPIVMKKEILPSMRGYLKLTSNS